jgi:hypothetical protein
MGNNKVIGIIREFIISAKEKILLEDGKHRFSGANYLLNQILRQYIIDDSHCFISEEAKKTWEKLELSKDTYKKDGTYKHSQDMEDYWYQRRIYITSVKGDIQLYDKKGTHYRTGAIINDSFQYNHLFHDEHIVTISDIIQALFDLVPNNLTDDKISNILDKIYICRILKSEREKLDGKEKNSRGLCYKDVIKIYFEDSKVNIKVLYEYHGGNKWE